MIYHFRVISNEVDDFIFEIAIDSKACFVDLHTFIQKELSFDSSQITSFFITDADWNKEVEITLLDMIEESEQHKVMDQVSLEDLLTQTKQRLLYTFDVFADRVLFMELTAINEGDLLNPACLRKEGTPPPPVAVDDFSLPDDLNEAVDSEGFDEDDFGWNDENPDDFPGEEPDDDHYY